MSNAPTNSRNQGDQQRRRRNRGGKNRRGQGGHNEHGQHQHQSREFSPGRDTRGQGQGRRPNQPGNTPPRKYAPAKLTWWQKLLKLVGLYKEPARPERRPAQQPDPRPQQEPKVKSNTRNLRSGEGEAGASPARERNRDQEGNRRPERRGGDRNSVESPRVYVGNLSYDVTESDLQDLFKGIGGVRNVEIVYNRATHRSKGYGFVEMLHVDEAKRAVEVLHDQHFMGRPMTVSGAKSKGLDEREDREERDERQERRPRERPAPEAAPAAAAATPVTADSLGDSGEIATIVETSGIEANEEVPAVAAVESASETPDEAAPAAEETKTEPA